MPTLPSHQSCAGDPRDHLGEVALLLLRVLVGRPPAAAASASDIQTCHRVVEFVAKPGVLGAVGRGQVVLAVRKRLEDAGLWAALGQVERDRQAGAVRHGNPLITPGPCHGGPSSARTRSCGRAWMVLPPTPVVVVAVSRASTTASSVASTVASK